MTIAIEADFRSIITSQTVDSLDPKKGKAGSGEAFATSLARARDGEAADTTVVSVEAAAATITLAIPQGISEQATLPDTPLTDPAGTLPLGADAAAALVKSEIVVDRQIVREGIEVQANAAPEVEAATVTASPPQAQAASATDRVASAPPGNRMAADQAPIAETAETSKIAVHDTAEPALVGNAGREPVLTPENASIAVAAAPTATASVTAALPATPSAKAAAPISRQTHQTEVSTDPEAFAVSLQNGEQLASKGAGSTETEIAPLTDIASKASPFDTASLSSTTATGTQSLAAVAAPVSPQTSAAATILPPSAPAFAVVTASPAQIVDIVAETADDGQSDRVVVQLDPPELGRVSIDFKFDAQGLQQVTITSETPEAMRQLRQMHSELVQSLERHGIGSENLSFQHQQQSAQQSPPQNPFAHPVLEDAPNSRTAMISTNDPIPGPRTLPGGRLDIRL